MSEEITMKDLLVAIKALSADVNDVKEKVENMDTRLERVESEMKEMRTEMREDIWRVDKKFELVLKDLYETKTDNCHEKWTAKGNPTTQYPTSPDREHVQATEYIEKRS